MREDGTPYLPSNGTEGISFEDHWCCRCKREEKFRENFDGEYACNIVATACFEQVPEWIYMNGSPVCTEFISVNTVRTKQCDSPKCKRRISLECEETLCARCRLGAEGQQSLFGEGP